MDEAKCTIPLLYDQFDYGTNLGPLVFVNPVYYHPADPSHGLEATGAELSILKCAWIDNKI